MNSFFLSFVFSLLALLPRFVFALTTTELLNRISAFIINPIIFTLLTASFVVFLWGLVQFIAHLDNEEARQTGGKHMLWGIIGMVLMVAVPGIVALIQNTLTQLGS